MLESKIFSEIHVMRKTVIDGSNTSGFQRTMLVAENGKIEIGSKRVGIQSIVLEEDSARPVEKKENTVVYSLDRQGIPLIEIATAPELFTPAEVQECAGKIGELLRRTCRAKRGLGTIRQDINISTREGARIELKGVQELGMIAEHVRRETQRQLSLIEIKKELIKRGAKPEGFGEVKADVTSALEKTACKFVKKAIESGKKAMALKLEGFAGIIGREVQPGRRFGTELADYLKARHGIKGLLHSDELPKYGVSEEEKREIAMKLQCKPMDAFVVIVEKPQKAREAFTTIRERCKTAMKKVPEETRNALENGNSSYSRPLPGAARMYPETDLETVTVEQKQLEKLKKELPLSLQERLELYSKHGLSPKLAGKMKLSNRACFFEELIARGINATTAAVLLLEDLKKLEREGINTSLVSEKEIIEILEAERGKRIGKESISKACRLGALKRIPAREAIKELESNRLESKEVEKIVTCIVEENSKLIKERGTRSAKALMGEAMKELRGKATGKEVMALLEKLIEKRLKKGKEKGE